MKKNENRFGDKLCVTASSQDHAHRAPVSFVVRRGVAIIIVVAVVCVVGLCIYTAANAMLTLKGLQGTNETLRQTVKAQESALDEYEQKIDEMQQTQQSAEPD